MQTIIIRKVIVRRRFSLTVGLKRCAIAGVNSLCKYFDIETTGDKVMFLGFYALCSIVGFIGIHSLVRFL